jgi:hypothetical protein
MIDDRKDTRLEQAYLNKRAGLGDIDTAGRIKRNKK